MKNITDRNSIVVKICRLHSHIPIDETSAKIVDCELLDLRDTDCFIDSLMKRSASRFIERQDEKQVILDENKPIEMSGELDLSSMVGKVVMGKWMIGEKTNEYEEDRIMSCQHYFKN